MIIKNWNTADGLKIAFCDLDQQHLSNILWFKEVVNKRTRYNCSTHFELGLELEKRFNGSRLPWRPLPVLDEIDYLKKSGLVDNSGNIIGTFETGLFNGKIIGSINHLK